MKVDLNIARSWGRAVALILVPLALMSCGSDSDDESVPTGGDTSAGVDGSVTTSMSDSGVTAQDVDGANSEKVLLAAVLLGVGDVDVALSEGLVTADEVDLAAAALATGTLAEWADRANAGS